MHWDQIGMQTQQICLTPGQFVGQVRCWGGVVFQMRGWGGQLVQIRPPLAAPLSPVLSPRLIKRICCTHQPTLCWPGQETAAGKRLGGHKRWLNIGRGGLRSRVSRFTMSAGWQWAQWGRVGDNESPWVKSGLNLATAQPTTEDQCATNQSATPGCIL